MRSPARLLVYLPLLGALGVGSAACSRDAEASPEAPSGAAAAPVNATAASGLPNYDPRQSLAPLIEQVGPAVVSIRAFGFTDRTAFSIPGFGSPRGERRGGHGTGSGFILSDDGIVITNHHVAGNAERLEVRLPDGRKFPAQLVGSDPATDVAVLQLENAQELPTVTLGDSSKLSVGDWVVAIGSPMGLEHSASVGILSARGRGSLGLYRDSYIDFLQTDADIAPGSSGGPLFNLAGEVVGINTAVGAVAQGPGFAIPIDQAKQIIVQLREKGQVIRGWLGAANEPDAEGAVVGKIFPDTPAARAGLQRGDLIKQVDGHAVASFDELRAMIAGLPPGHAALFTVDRGGKELELTAVLSERPGAHDLDRLAADRSLTPPTAPFPTPVPPAGPRLGVQAKAHDKGLEVVRVEPGSLGDDLDLQAGDIIIRLNGATVHRPEDVAAALERERAKVDIELMRNGVKHRVTLERS